MTKKKERSDHTIGNLKPDSHPAAEPPGEAMIRVVGIGASAGGLEALEQFFSHMPADKGIAFVVVQHLDPTGHSSMPQILSRFTKMPTAVAQNGMRVEPNSIYLLPPSKNMGVRKGTLFLQEPAHQAGPRLPIDFFLRTLAKEMGSDAIGVILSGTGTDGTLGLRAIKAELGTVFVQNPDSARYDGMPRSAIDTGLADFVLKPGEMPEKLIHFIEHSAIHGARLGDAAEEALEPLKQIFAILRTRSGHDFSRYKRSTIRRRLQRRMSVHQITDLAGYAHFLRESEEEEKALLKDLLISVTSFFRDPEAFEALKKQVTDLIKSRAPGSDLRIWVAGCATGEEAYSVAIILRECLDELEKHLQVQIYGTDIDVDALQTARAAKYPGNIAVEVGPDRIRKFFIKENETFRVRKELREAIVFAPQNFIKDPPFSKMDLICCRNLLIYLESDVQKRLLPLLHYALKPGGILFLGPSETAGDSADLFQLAERKWKIYRRREVAVSAERLKFPASFAPGTHSAVGETVRETNDLKIPELAEKIFLDSYAPTFAVVDEKFRLVYVRGRTGRYLEIASGQPTWTILEMAREGLKPELASALYRATSEKRKIVRDGLQVKTNGEYQTINLTVAPLPDGNLPSGLLMIVFQDASPALGEGKARQSAKSRRRAVELEDELRLTKTSLQTSIEELEATNEELKSANEELQSNNEELQSTNEELDTSREELQSLNEELTTLNAELQDKNELLSKANDDLKNFLNRTDIAILFLDEELKIRRYTPATSDVFHVRDIDIGRPLAEITSRLGYEGIVQDAQEVLRHLRPKEMEVRRREGTWFKMRILPYLTAQNVVSGLVMSFLDINEQKKGAEALTLLNQDLEEMARFPQENPNPTLRVDPKGVILTANPTCSKIEAFPCRPGLTLPLRYKKMVAEVIRTGSPLAADIEGQEHTFTLNFVPGWKSGYVNIYTNDITERRKAEIRLRKSEERYRFLFENLNSAVVLIEPIWEENGRMGNFRYLAANPAVKKHLGKSPEEMVGKCFSEVFSGQKRNTVFDIYERVLCSGEPYNGEILLPALKRYFDLSVFRPAEGQLALSLTDIHERKIVEQTKDDFIGMVSHEIRTPLTKIIAAIATAGTQGISPEEARRMLMRGTQSADHLGHIVTNLIELARFRSGRMVLEREEYRIGEILRELVDSDPSGMLKKRITVHLPDGLPAARGDKMRVKLILTNLIDNAVKYSQEDSEIMVSVRRAGEVLVIRVSDEGIGISAEEQSRVFQLFERIENRDRPVSGLGVGLIVCKHLVESLGGRIRVRSVPGRGSSFSFTIPLDRDTPA